MNIRKSILFLWITTALLALYGCQNNKQEDSKEIAEEKNEAKFTDKANEKDAQFVVDVIAGNLAEIKLAELGEQQSKNNDVREIATMLKAQHTDILTKLKNYATLKQISVPSDVTPEAKKEEDEVRDEKDFDEEWCADIKTMHEKSIKKFEDASTEVTDPELKDLAAETLPTIRMHYDRITACKDKLEK